MTEATVLVEWDGPVAVVTMNRPDVRNAVDAAQAAALLHAIASVQSARAIVLAARGTAFCAGLDLKEVRTGNLPSTAFVHAVADAGPPVIGAINGACVAAGLDLAMACDVLIASEAAVFADTHVRIGLAPPDRLVSALADRAGPAFALEMVLSAAPVDAATALRVGLVNHVVPAHELDARARALAHAVAAGDEAVSAQVLTSFRRLSARV